MFRPPTKRLAPLAKRCVGSLVALSSCPSSPEECAILVSADRYRPRLSEIFPLNGQPIGAVDLNDRPIEAFVKCLTRLNHSDLGNKPLTLLYVFYVCQPFTTFHLGIPVYSNCETNSLSLIVCIKDSVVPNRQSFKLKFI